MPLMVIFVFENGKYIGLGAPRGLQGVKFSPGVKAAAFFLFFCLHQAQTLTLTTRQDLHYFYNVNDAWVTFCIMCSAI